MTLAVAASTAAVESAATATAVESTTTSTAVESAAGITAVESTAGITAVEATGAAAYEGVAASGITGWAMVKAVSGSGVSNAAAIAVVISGVAVVSGVAIVATATVVTTATPVSTPAPITVVPGAGADKEATHEPARSVVAIGRAGVRIIRVVAPGTDRSRVPITVVPVSSIPVSSIPDTDTHTYLSVSGSRHQRCGNQRAEQQKISEKLHFEPPRQGIMQCVTNRFGDTSGTLGYSGAYYLKPHFP